MKKILLAVLLLSVLPSFAMAQQTSSCVNLTKDLRQGMKNANTNNEVGILQKFLKSKGFLGATPNGLFGSATTMAVKKFQSNVGLGSAGTPGYGGVGPKSRAKIKEMTCGGAATAIPVTTTISAPIPAQAPVTTAAITSVVSPATTQAVIPMSAHTESSWVIVFTHRGTPLPNEIMDFICGTVKSNVVSWIDREFTKNQITKPFDNIVCLTDQILLSEKQLLGGEKITGEGVTFTNPINDSETSKFLENKIPSLIKAKYITVFHYMVPTELQFANHALSPTPKYDFEFITSFNLPDGKMTFIPPSTDIDTYSQELVHEFLHKMWATDKYYFGQQQQGCKTDTATGQQYSGYDIMCHRIPMWEGFITPKFSELIISGATAKEIKK